MAELCRDDALVPTVYSHTCKRFDFSLYFEDAVFAIFPIPDGIMCSAGQPISRIAKSTMDAISFCQFAASLDFASAVAIGLLSYSEHVKSARPAPLINTYILATMLLDGARARTIWLLRVSSVLPSVFIASVALKFVLLILQSFPKMQFLLPSEREYTAEESAGILSLSSFAWLHPLIIRGYRHRLSIDDLYPVGHSMSSKSVHSGLQKIWKLSKKDKSYSLFLATAKALWLPLSVPMVPQLFLVALNLAQPLLLATAVSFVESGNDKPAGFGYSLIGAFGLTYFGIAIATAWYQYLSARALTMIRGALIGLTYSSMLDMHDGDEAASSSLSLINVDIERIVTSLQWVVGIAPDVIQVGIAIWLLEARIGAIFIAPVLVVIDREVHKIEAKIMDAGNLDQKWDYVGNININKRRENARTNVSDIEISNIVIGNSPRLLSPIITFIGFGIVVKLSGDKAPSTAIIFSSLSLLSILIDPVNELVAVGPNLAVALDCFNRVQQYVTNKKRVDYRIFSHRKPLDEDTSTARSETGRNNAMETTTLENTELALSTTATKSAIQLRNVDAGWSTQTLTLRDVSLDLNPSTLSLIIGDIGTGKSTLLKLLLGEVPVLAKGSVSLATDEVAFCGQTPFLRNQSIRDNIIGPFAHDAEWYGACIDACALDVDFEQMVEKDGTVVGSRGMSLSGGQKQRIALARTVYSRRRIILLDDVLSSLDTISERHCFDRLFGPSGLFKYLQSTVIFVTHSAKWLPYADKIVALGPNRTIQQAGSYEDLISSPGYVQDVMSTTKEKEPEIESSSSREISQYKHEGNKETTVETVETESSPDNARKSSSSALFYISSMRWSNFLAFTVLVGVEVGTNGIQPLWLSWWSDASQRSPNVDLGKWMGGYAAFGLLSLCFLGLCGGYLLIEINPKSSSSLHLKTLRSTMGAPIAHLTDKTVAKILNLFSQDMTLISMSLPIALILATGSFGNSVIGAVLTSVSSGYMAISTPILFVTLYFLQKLYLRTSQQLRALDLESKCPILEHFMETLQGLATIRSLSWTSHLISDTFHHLDQSQKPFYLLLCIQSWLNLVLNVIVAALAVVLMMLTVTLRDRISPGLLGVALISVVNFGQTLSLFVSYWTVLETSLTAIERIKDYIADAPKEDSLAQQEADVPWDWPVESRVEFRHVSASYRSNGPDVLKDLSISIPPRQTRRNLRTLWVRKIHIDLISVLLRLLKPSKGSVIIGSQDISIFAQQTVCKRVTSMPQDAWFIPRGCGESVRENMDPLREVDDDIKIYDVLDKTDLREHIDNLGGLDAQLGQQGNGVLSSGQKQLFCLARAMLTRRGGILIMDEAMSNVDYKTELKILSLLRSDFQGWTIIAFTHHLRFIPQFFDRVVVMDEGRVVEYDDDPGRLLADPSSLFRRLSGAENDRDNSSRVGE
ncbi:multidrug resistance protein, putative [Talaromyces stipitatus ATCC 10500]|uniref:Multidrug resistance protein, putative n=1 Tax=Talaromyces stipitatus (strain ATCC 10500 / CBS 375.48 / QM 6759 / NRRL 1006) TaxID=441959 RepID=B8MRU1_TALSN|nr:multidrug resistance protein, putative [Talaromyces stipitatus ATCC 10500]EED13275.1 multidrug resistance protein, putative [Talaromyces stipitatus ATCC 10500]